MVSLAERPDGRRLTRGALPAKDPHHAPDSNSQHALGQNLIKPGGLNAPYWLVFPHYDVKNRVDLNFQFDQPLTDLIDEYVHEFRPAVLRGANGPYLFPGEGGSPRVANSFSWQITKRIEKAVGLRITVHQFRHAAAAIYLKDRPGDYETVRRVLAHRRYRDDHQILLRITNHAGHRAISESSFVSRSNSMRLPSA